MAHRYRYASDASFGHRGWVPPFPVAMNVSPRHFKCPLPTNDADFAILSEIIFGAPLSLSQLWLHGEYGRAEIAQRYDDFATVDGYFSSHENAGYDRIGWFWQTVMGPMGTSRSLTTTGIKIVSHRQRARIENWIKHRRDNRGSTPSAPFVRLAHRYGVGENIVNRNRPPASGVLPAGRADGAAAVSLIGGEA